MARRAAKNSGVLRWVRALLLAACWVLSGSALAQTEYDRSDAVAVRLQREITAIRAGQPHYDEMVPLLREAARQQQAAVQKALTHMGALESITFKRSHKNVRIYELWFANGRSFWAIGIEPDGKIESLWFAGR